MVFGLLTARGKIAVKDVKEDYCELLYPFVKWCSWFWDSLKSYDKTPYHIMMVSTATHIMTSSNGNIFRVTGHLCREFTSLRWIPHTNASDMELDVFFDLRLNK